MPFSKHCGQCKMQNFLIHQQSWPDNSACVFFAIFIQNSQKQRKKSFPSPVVSRCRNTYNSFMIGYPDQQRQLLIALP